MKRTIILFFVLCLVPFLSPAQQTNLLWEKAARTFFTADLNGSAAILRDILRDPHTGASDSAKVYGTLALRDWQFQHDYDLANKRLDSALAIAASGNAALVARSNIAAEAERYTTSLEAAEKALGLAATPTEHRDAAIAYANTVYLSSKNNKHPDTLLLNKGGQLLMEALQQMPGLPQAAKLLVGTGILKKDGRLVLMGWNAYFHFVRADSAYPYLRENARTLSTILPHWKGNTLPAAEREQVARALAGSGFYEHAALLAGPSQRDIIVYARYLQQLGSLAGNYYRQLAQHTSNDSLFEQQVMQLCGGVLRDLHLSAGKDSLTYEKFLEIMQPRFGTMGFFGATSSSSAREVCLGHIVNITHKEVLQYGYKASLTFIEIDLMTSNGFISWLSGKRSGNGGWSVNDTIYRVREVYMKQPVEAWTLVSDSTIRREQLAIFEKAIAGTSPDTSTLLNAIDIRLRINAMDSLYAALYKQGLRGSDLQLQFMNTLERKEEEASIFAHEGRHSIDQIYFAKDFEKAPNSEREYRAKLSEITCADFPLFIFGKLISSPGTSGHGMANRKILEEALIWVGKHQDEISGYDTRIPAIKQLHLLSASQIQTCFREADPLSKQ